MTSNIATIQPARPVALGPVFQPQSFGELMKFADMIQNSDLLPPGYKGKPGNIVLAVQMGSEVGLSPMQAIQSIAVINGRPAIWGDGMMGLVRQSPSCENITETITGEGDARIATCIAKRRGADAVTSTFSVADAKRAGLFGKQGPWTQYPDRMLKQRARGFALRDAFADVLKGLKTVEELQDYPAPHREPAHAGGTIDMTATPEPEPVKPEGPSFGNRVDKLLALLPNATTLDQISRQEIKMAGLMAELVAADRTDLIERVNQAFTAARDALAPSQDDDGLGDVP